MDTLFFYGSLRDRRLTEVVVGQAVSEARFRPARAPGYATRALPREAYPMLVEAPGEAAEGVVLSEISAVERARLEYFEEAEYGLVPITVETDTGPVEAAYFRATDKPGKTDTPWDFARWQTEERATAIAAAEEYMSYFGRLSIEEVDAIWPAIMARARQKTRAAATPPTLGRVRTAFGPDDVSIEAHARPYAGFLTVETLRLRHKRFDGGWSPSLERTVVLWGDAVTVLPYDPVRDAVLLIEQFRPAPLGRGDPNPWCLEVVAGRIDGDRGPEATARTEAAEEAGLALGRLREIGRYYSTAGLAGEHMTAFVGEADLSAPGGLHGVADEGEDIRTMVLDWQEAWAAVTDGAVNTAQALFSLYWLAAHRESLRAAWVAEGQSRSAGGT
ncbi:MAG: gamma-glutamylcyclotransferase [Paracoccaceae bacterium]